MLVTHLLQELVRSANSLSKQIHPGGSGIGLIKAVAKFREKIGRPAHIVV